MRTINLGGQQRGIEYNLYAAKLMKKLTGLNILDGNCLSEIFGDEEVDIDSFDKFAKFVYCGLAAADLPDDADEDWRPEEYSPNGVLKWVDMKEFPTLMKEVASVYLGVTVEDMDEFSKNVKAPSKGLVGEKV